MSKNNKKRILALLKILEKHSDSEHPISLPHIVEHLQNDYAIDEVNRKTVYDDLKTLEDFGYPIQSEKKGYSLSASPFYLSEIKIILDAIHSLKNLDSHFQMQLKEKLYRFISLEEEKVLESLFYQNEHHDDHFLFHIETILYAIYHKETLLITIRGRKSEIKPLFLYRLNEYYYLFYSYMEKEEIYRVRFDRIEDLCYTSHPFETTITKEKILQNIEESSDLFHSKNTTNVVLQLSDTSDVFLNRLNNDFPNIIIHSQKKTAALKVSVNDIFFSKLTAYKDKIKVLEPESVSQSYQDYLQTILKLYLPLK